MPGAHRLIQITDSHLYADPSRTLKGVCTYRNLADVVDLALGTGSRCDAILATGDMAEDGCQASYGHLVELFEPFNAPVYWIPGNHDDPEVMSECLKPPRFRRERWFRLGNWRIILLDTRVPGRIGGRLTREELDFLDLTLASDSSCHNLVCLHHQPVPVGSLWIDRIGLENGQDFLDIVERHNSVRAVLWGHVHQEYAQLRNHIQFLGSPSSCVQFRPGARLFATDTVAPGYRWLELYEDGTMCTDIHRLPAQQAPGLTAGA